jgi:hypothetical protein
MGWRTKAYLRRSLEARTLGRKPSLVQRVAITYHDFLSSTANQMTFQPRLFLWGHPFWSN